MKFEELKKEIKTFKFYEMRADNDDYFEAVIEKKDLDTLNLKLNSIFGAPAWPSETKLSAEVNNLIWNHGGVMAGQTLYFTHMDNSPVFVMLWPWGDKEHITVKAGSK
jgi:hypothetical protein